MWITLLLSKQPILRTFETFGAILSPPSLPVS